MQVNKVGIKGQSSICLIQQLKLLWLLSGGFSLFYWIIKPFRYKERIRTKLIKSMHPNSISKFLNTKDWTFVKDGLDDFRDGLPPPAHDSDIIHVR